MIAPSIVSSWLAFNQRELSKNICYASSLSCTQYICSSLFVIYLQKNTLCHVLSDVISLFLHKRARGSGILLWSLESTGFYPFQFCDRLMDPLWTMTTILRYFLILIVSAYISIAFKRIKWVVDNSRLLITRAWLTFIVAFLITFCICDKILIFVSKGTPRC